MYNNELCHFGVKGMKWGHHKYVSSYSKSYNNASNRLDSAMASYKSSKGQDRKIAKQEYKKAKSAYKTKRKDEINDLSYRLYNKHISDTPNAPFAGRSTMNIKTYKKAAKKMVDKGMDEKSAVKSARRSSMVNAGASVAAAILYNNRNAIKDKAVKAVDSRVKTKGMQKANAGLKRIGTFQYEKVSGNVYKQVMK